MTEPVVLEPGETLFLTPVAICSIFVRGEVFTVGFVGGKPFCNSVSDFSTLTIFNKASNLLLVVFVVVHEEVVEFVWSKPFLVSFWLFSRFTILNNTSSLASVGSIVLDEKEAAAAIEVEQVPGAIVNEESEPLLKLVSVVQVVSVVDWVPGTV